VFFVPAAYLIIHARKQTKAVAEGEA